MKSNELYTPPVFHQLMAETHNSKNRNSENFQLNTKLNSRRTFYKIISHYGI